MDLNALLSYKPKELLAICRFQEGCFSLPFVDWKKIHDENSWDTFKEKTSLPVYRINVDGSGHYFIMTRNEEGQVEDDAFREFLFESSWIRFSSIIEDSNCQSLEDLIAIGKKGMIRYDVEDARLFFLLEEGKMSLDVYSLGELE